MANIQQILELILRADVAGASQINDALGQTETRAKATSGSVDELSGHFVRGVTAGVTFGLAAERAGEQVLETAKAIAEESLQLEKANASLSVHAEVSTRTAAAISSGLVGGVNAASQSLTTQVEVLARVAPALKLSSDQTLTLGQAQAVLQAGTALAVEGNESLARTLPTVIALNRTFGDGYVASASIIHNASLQLMTDSDAVAAAALRMHDRFGPLAPSLQESATLMVQFAEAGLTGQRGLMLISSGVDNLLSSTGPAKAELKSLNVDLYDAGGAARPFMEIMDQLVPILTAMTDKERLAAEQLLFGASAGTAFDTVIKNWAVDHPKAAEAISDTTSVLKDQAAQLNTTSGQWEKFKNTVGGEISSDLSGGFFKGMIQGINQFLDKSREFDALLKVIPADSADMDTLIQAGFVHDYAALDALVKKYQESHPELQHFIENNNRIAAVLGNAEAAMRTYHTEAGTAVVQTDHLASAVSAAVSASDGWTVNLKKIAAGALEAGSANSFLAGTFLDVARAANSVATIATAAIEKQNQGQKQAADQQEARNKKAIDLETEVAQAYLKGEPQIAAALQQEIVALRAGDEVGAQRAANAAKYAGTEIEVAKQVASTQETAARKEEEAAKQAEALHQREVDAAEKAGAAESATREKLGEQYNQNLNKMSEGLTGLVAKDRAAWEQQLANARQLIPDQFNLVQDLIDRIEELKRQETAVMSEEDRKQLENQVTVLDAQLTAAQHAFDENVRLAQEAEEKIKQARRDQVSDFSEALSERESRFQHSLNIQHDMAAKASVTGTAEEKAAKQAVLDADIQLQRAEIDLEIAKSKLKHDLKQAELGVQTATDKSIIESTASTTKNQIFAAGQVAEAQIGAASMTKEAWLTADEAIVNAAQDAVDAAENAKAKAEDALASVTAQAKEAKAELANQAKSGSGSESMSGYDFYAQSGQLTEQGTPLSSTAGPRRTAASDAYAEGIYAAATSAGFNYAANDAFYKSASGGGSASAGLLGGGGGGSSGGLLQGGAAAAAAIVPPLQSAVDVAKTLHDQFQETLQPLNDQLGVLHSADSVLSDMLNLSRDRLAAEGNSSATDKALLQLQVRRDELVVSGANTAEIDKQISQEQARIKLLGDKDALDNLGITTQLANQKVSEDTLNLQIAQKTAVFDLNHATNSTTSALQEQLGLWKQIAGVTGAVSDYMAHGAGTSGPSLAERLQLEYDSPVYDRASVLKTAEGYGIHLKTAQGFATGGILPENVVAFGRSGRSYTMEAGERILSPSQTAAYGALGNDIDMNTLARLAVSLIGKLASDHLEGARRSELASLGAA